MKVSAVFLVTLLFFLIGGLIGPHALQPSPEQPLPTAGNASFSSGEERGPKALSDDNYAIAEKEEEGDEDNVHSSKKSANDGSDTAILFSFSLMDQLLAAASNNGLSAQASSSLTSYRYLLLRVIRI